MIELLLGIAAASSGLFLVLNITKSNKAKEDIWLQGWLSVYFFMSLGFWITITFSDLIAIISEKFHRFPRCSTTIPW